ncbi:hypothetical protein SSS_03433 [Sarcoptes scabiei]|uniref:Uncharacterized protein n=1 Tax=Sarcoptes scabiei TaxID=52283 RepID=A0A131ZSN0_SARSC|nr:hypothetical protein SSS_03433 [Sarcoptes scabiei]KPL94069.1 hypothetical protein QR98_0001320 [Sarcoptes scabiei]UXI19215.1 hypothetical protein NH340_JMT05158 [Sarcoptes scabiei]
MDQPIRPGQSSFGENTEPIFVQPGFSDETPGPGCIEFTESFRADRYDGTQFDDIPINDGQLYPNLGGPSAPLPGGTTFTESFERNVEGASFVAPKPGFDEFTSSNFQVQDDSNENYYDETPRY